MFSFVYTKNTSKCIQKRTHMLCLRVKQSMQHTTQPTFAQQNQYYAHLSHVQTVPIFVCSIYKYRNSGVNARLIIQVKYRLLMCLFIETGKVDENMCGLREYLSSSNAIAYCILLRITYYILTMIL